MSRKFVSYAALVLLLSGTVSFAAQPAARSTEWSIGPEIYYHRYEEPAFDVKNEGAMYGVAGEVAYHDPSRVVLKADGHAAWGSIDYESSSSGTLNDIDDYVFEGRVLAGYEWDLNNGWFMTPFFGVGYRYLNDDSSGQRSSNGAAGYERESNYFYSPAGIEFATQINPEWSLGINVEYDIFWSGKQESHLGDAIAGLNTISNDQEDGYGVRGAVQLKKKGAQYDIVIEPFIRWWSVEDSTASNITYAGVIVGYGYEPKNETLEVGGKISFLF